MEAAVVVVVVAFSSLARIMEKNVLATIPGRKEENTGLYVHRNH